MKIFLIMNCLMTLMKPTKTSFGMFRKKHVTVTTINWFDGEIADKISKRNKLFKKISRQH